MNNSVLNNTDNSGINGDSDDITVMDSWEDRRISITLQYGSLKEVLVLERSDNPQVLYQPQYLIHIYIHRKCEDPFTERTW